ncbi:MAG: hypothetical protein ACREE4_23625 [Stellaceae bacterium]
MPRRYKLLQICRLHDLPEPAVHLKQHYGRVIAALADTIRIQEEIDNARCSPTTACATAA